MTIIAGVDSSTQSCTVALYDLGTGSLLGVGVARHPRTNPPRSEQHTSHWWSAFAASLSSACTDANVTAGDIRAISIAAQYHGLVALDSAGELLRPAKLWNDTTSSAQARTLIESRPAGWWPREVGSTPTAAFTITKLAWMAEHEPDLFARIRSVMVPHDWLTLRLTGRRVTDRVDASGTGYYDAVRGCWREDILDEVGLAGGWADRLPLVLGPEEPAGRADSAAARELGLRPDTVVACGTGDQAAAALALGVGDGCACISLGTSGTVITGSRTPVHDPHGEINVTANAQGGFQPIAVVLNAAKVTDTFARLLNVDHDGLSRLALDADPAPADRPLLVGYLDGERTPDRPDARGMLAGLSADTTREQLALSAYEGVCLGLRAGLDAIREMGVEVDGPVVITGGAASSEAYRRVLSDTLDAELVASDSDSSLDVTRGAALQAATALTGSSLAHAQSAWAQKMRLAATPDPHRAGAAEAAYRRYRTAREIRDLDGLFTSTPN